MTNAEKINVMDMFDSLLIPFARVKNAHKRKKRGTAWGWKRNLPENETYSDCQLELKPTFRKLIRKSETERKKKTIRKRQQQEKNRNLKRAESKREKERDKSIPKLLVH